MHTDQQAGKGSTVTFKDAAVGLKNNGSAHSVLYIEFGSAHVFYFYIWCISLTLHLIGASLSLFWITLLSAWHNFVEGCQEEDKNTVRWPEQNREGSAFMCYVITQLPAYKADNSELINSRDPGAAFLTGTCLRQGHNMEVTTTCNDMEETRERQLLLQTLQWVRRATEWRTYSSFIQKLLGGKLCVCVCGCLLRTKNS